MLLLRIYISLLALVFSVLVIVSNGLGILSGLVITSSLLFLIFDIKSEVAEIDLFEQRIKQFESFLEHK